MTKFPAMYSLGIAEIVGVDDQERAEIIKEIFKMRRRRKSLHKITADLNERNIPTANGGKWYAGTVNYILKNKLYKGVLDYSSVKTRREDLAIM